MNLNGYIKLHRKMMAWQWINHPPTFCLFIHLLMMAAYEPDGQSGLILQPGQVSAGKRELSKRTGLSEQQVLTALSHLKATGEISISTVDRKYSIITIQNWTKYQISPSGQPSDPPSQENPETLAGQGFQQFSFGRPTQGTTQKATQGARPPRNPPREPPSGQPSDPPSQENPETLAGQGISENPHENPPSDPPRNPPTEPPTDPPTLYKEIKKVKKDKNINRTPRGEAGFVFLSDEEYEKLAVKYGKPFLEKCIERLGSYIGSKGKDPYKSHYYVINSGWLPDQIRQTYPNLLKRQPQQQTLQVTTTPNDSEWGDGI